MPFLETCSIGIFKIRHATFFYVTFQECNDRPLLPYSLNCSLNFSRVRPREHSFYLILSQQPVEQCYGNVDNVMPSPKYSLITYW